MAFEFNIKDYNTHGHERVDSSRVQITIPQTPFMVAPPGEEAHWDLDILHSDGCWFLVNPRLRQELNPDDVVRAVLYPAIKSNGTIFLLPVTEPYPNVPWTWFEAWQEIIPVARRHWTRVRSNKTEGVHEHTTVKGLEPPSWPGFKYTALLKSAFSQRVINTMRELRAARARYQSEVAHPIEED